MASARSRSPVGRTAAAFVALIAFFSGTALAAEPETGRTASFPQVVEPSAVARFDTAPATEPVLVRPVEAQPAPTVAPQPTAPAAISISDAQSIQKRRKLPEPYRTAEEPDGAIAGTHEARPPVADRPPSDEPHGSNSDRWVLSVEGVTHAPIDVGLQAGIELPVGLRLYGGYGFMPSGYLHAITSIASMVSEGDPTTAAVIRGFNGARTWRVQAGIRPKFLAGFYLDAGYSVLSLSGSVDASDVAVADAFGVEPGSTLDIESTVRMWLVELGYQTDIAGRIVLGVGIGAMGALAAQTHVTVPSSAAAEQPSVQDAAKAFDAGVERYGFVPTLTLRLGFDVI